MALIQIQTPQHVRIEFETAAIWERTLAFLIDLCIMATGYVLLVLSLIQYISNADWEDRFFVLIFPFGPIITFFLYHFLSERYFSGQSLGKKIIGIRVLRLDGTIPTSSDCAMRALFYLVDSILSMGTLALLSVSTSPNRQRLGDKAAHTVVVRRQHSVRFSLDDIMRLQEVEGYTPRYLQVQNLSEQDMLTVKTALFRYQKYKNQAHTAALNLLASRLRNLLHIEMEQGDATEFLKTLLKDYIFLTR